MTEAPKVYGWCPGALRPMQSGDGLVVRVRVPLGRLQADQARAIAELSQRFGNGLIDLSARANMQLRGVTPDSHPPLIDALRGLGLIDADIAAETRRNLVIQPFWTDGDATHQITRALTRALAQPDAPDLPGKFGFAVDCGDQPRLTATSADIRIERSDAGLICRADGTRAGIPVTVDSAAETALNMARWFVENGGVTDGRGRMRALTKRLGAPQGSTVAAASGLAPPKPGITPQGALVALEYGQMPASALADLATGALRLTPWQMLLVEGADTLPDHPHLITDPQDSRLNIRVCTGAPGCQQALSTTRDLAGQISHHVSAPLHISGCAKGCAHPAPCATTLTATSQGHFDLIRAGRASDPASARDMTLPDLLSERL